MRIASLPRPLLVAGIVFALFPMLLSAQQQEPARNKRSASPVEKLRQDLEQTVTLPDAFKPGETYPLGDVLDALHKQMKFKFSIYNRDFAEEGLIDVKSVPLVLPEVKAVKVKDFLRNLVQRVPIAPTEGTYVLVNDTIIIVTSAQALHVWMQQLISLDCEKEELSSVLKRLANETDTNLVIDARAAKEAQTLISLQMHDVTLEMAVYLLADMISLQPVRVGNVLYLTTKANAVRMRAEPELARMIGPCPLQSPHFPATPAN